MATEQDRRIRQLCTLIAGENDAEKMTILAAELERLLAVTLDEMRSSPKSGNSRSIELVNR
jgi:hypothetical protein